MGGLIQYIEVKRTIFIKKKIMNIYMLIMIMLKQG